jgi:hypothetical protein
MNDKDSLFACSPGVAAAFTAGLLVLIQSTSPATAVAAEPGGKMTAPAPATVTIKPETGATLGERFVGISFEKKLLVQPPLTKGNLAQYLKTLGPGVLRFGGNQVDKTFWTSTGEKPPAWGETTLTPQDLERLATLVKASGWQVLYGLNLKHKDAARAADEAAAAKRILGDALIGIEVGNEPNYYSKEIPGYSPAQYHADYELYREAIAKVAPGLGLLGPGGGSAPNAIEFLTDFAKRQQANPKHNLEALTTHFYPHCARNPPVPTMADLLSLEFHNRIRTRVQILVDSAKPLGVKTRLTEANSLTCGGVDGVSDRYGSALWLVDQAMLVASLGVTAENFHSNIAVCGGPKPPGSAYTPFCAVDPTDQAAGKLTAQPEYYGLLLVREVGPGTFSAVENSDPATLRAYALRSGDRLKVVLVNLSDPTTSGPRQVTVEPGAKFRKAELIRMTGPAFDAKTGITLAGKTVGSDGTFPAIKPTRVAVSSATLKLTLPPGTATLVTLTSAKP